MYSEERQVILKKLCGLRLYNNISNPNILKAFHLVTTLLQRCSERTVSTKFKKYLIRTVI